MSTVGIILNRQNKKARGYEKSSDIINIASKHLEPSLMEELYYCGSQVIYIGVILTVLALIAIVFISLTQYGRPFNILYEFFIAFGIDQVKSILIQPVVRFREMVVVVLFCKKTWNTSSSRLGKME